MKNWQFITLLSVIIIWFIYFGYKINKMEKQQEYAYSSIIANAVDISHVKWDTETIIGVLPDILN